MYIRTKDRIIDTDKNSGLIFTAPDGRQIIDFNINGWFEIIAQANTIDELCDEFVAHNTIVNKMVNYDAKRYTIGDLVGLGYKEIYGAIWTSKGLIYVAKLDDEGKLVLI